MLDQRGDPAPVRVNQTFLGADIADEAGVANDRCRVARHDGVELRLHLEDLAEVRIDAPEVVVHVGIAQGDDADVDSHRFRLERAGRE